MKIRAWVVLGIAVAGVATPRAADACGAGGVVSTRAGSVGANAQRVILSVNRGASGGQATTDIVVQLGVPESTQAYGALIPVPSEPTLDATPIPAGAIDQLDEATAPKIVSQGDDSGSSGCGCGSVGALGADKSGDQPGVRASAPVNIGPVTAVTLAGTPEAVSAWLGQNGFAVSAADQEMIAHYSDGYNGGYFIAIRRNDAVTSAPSSIGVHFSMMGDHRGLSLQFASLGAPATVAFTTFVVANETTGPSEPFTALTLDSLNLEIVRHSGYAHAVRSAVQAKGNRAFVIESRTPVSELPPSDLTRLFAGSTVTRLSTVLPASALTADAEFDEPFEGDVPNMLFVQSSVESGYRTAGMGSFPALLLLGLWRRRRPQR